MKNLIKTLENKGINSKLVFEDMCSLFEYDVDYINDAVDFNQLPVKEKNELIEILQTHVRMIMLLCNKQEKEKVETMIRKRLEQLGFERIVLAA